MSAAVALVSMQNWKRSFAVAVPLKTRSAIGPSMDKGASCGFGNVFDPESGLLGGAFDAVSRWGDCDFDKSGTFFDLPGPARAPGAFFRSHSDASAGTILMGLDPVVGIPAAMSLRSIRSERPESLEKAASPIGLVGLVVTVPVPVRRGEKEKAGSHPPPKRFLAHPILPRHLRRTPRRDRPTDARPVAEDLKQRRGHGLVASVEAVREVRQLATGGAEGQKSPPPPLDPLSKLLDPASKPPPPPWSYEDEPPSYEWPEDPESCDECDEPESCE